MSFQCPSCGTDVSPNAKGCAKCGSTLDSWSRAEDYDGLDLSDEEFDYDEFARQEFGQPIKPRHVSWLWWVAAIVLVVAILTLILQGRWWLQG